MSRRTLSAIVLDLVILFVLVATVWRVFGGDSAFARKEADPRPTIRAGMVLDLPGVDWGQTHRNVVLALRTTCRACIASAPLQRTGRDCSFRICISCCLIDRSVRIRSRLADCQFGFC